MTGTSSEEEQRASDRQDRVERVGEEKAANILIVGSFGCSSDVSAKVGSVSTPAVKGQVVDVVVFYLREAAVKATPVPR